MREFATPVVVLSRCLELEPVRYNAQVIPFPLVQPATGRDLTGAMEGFSRGFLAGLTDVDGFILKSRSPSCGTRDVKVYGGTGDGALPVAKRAGFFAAAVQERFGGLAIEDEGRLLNHDIRDHFFTRLFAFAALRRVRAEGTLAQLVQFHAEHKLLLMAYHQQEMRALGRIVASSAQLPFDDVVTAYREHFQRALTRPARHPSNINVLMHALGYVSDGLSQAEKAYFLDLLERYRDRRIPLGSVLTVLRSWILRFEVGYLARQTWLQPYPEPLMSTSDSGKGRPV